MRKINEENERAKRAYVFYLEQAKGLDQKSTDKVLAAILKFEESTGFKSFKHFHIEQASRFKAVLAKAKGRTGQATEPRDHRRHPGSSARVLSLACRAERLQVADFLQRHRIFQKQS